MKITKQQLEQIIKEELQNTMGSAPLKEKGGGIEPMKPPFKDDPAMSTGWKLDRILEILEAAPYAPKKI